MNLQLTREQLVTLLTCVHAATHILEDKDCRELEAHLLMRAEEEGMADMVTVEENKRTLAHLLSHELHEHIKAFEDNALWSSLADEMGEKDMRVAYTEAELAKMNENEFHRTLDTFADYYDKEFEAHGVDHLTVDHPLTLTGT